MTKVLFVVTAAKVWTLKDGTEHPTGYWAEELLTPYEIFTKAGDDVVFATPGGVAPVADEGSLSPDVNNGKDLRPALEAIDGLKHPLNLDDVNLGDFDAVFYPGGHGPMEDLATDATSGKLLVDALSSGKPLGIVCHGPAALLAAQDDGKNVFAGKHVTGFSNEEERQGGLANKAKWLLEDRLKDAGVDVRVGEPWKSNVVVDGNLVTGQNPASSAGVANEMLHELKAHAG